MNFNLSHVDLKKGMEQIPLAIKTLLSTPAFIKKHKLWKGFMDHTWIFLFSIVIAVAFTYLLYNNIHDYFAPPEPEAIEIESSSEGTTEGSTEGLDASIEAMEAMKESMPEEAREDIEEAIGEMFASKEMMEGDHKPFFSGSLKFLLLIFLEVLIFHFAVSTNNILKEEKKVHAFKSFTKAQMRMIIVMGRKFAYGLAMFIIVSVMTGVTDSEYLKAPIMFFIYGYYLGFAFLDNYLEQYEFSIFESGRCIQAHFGAATVFGIFTSVMMSIPIIGPLLVPFLCAIAATRYGHAVKMETFPRKKKIGR